MPQFSADSLAAALAVIQEPGAALQYEQVIIYIEVELDLEGRTYWVEERIQNDPEIG